MAIHHPYSQNYEKINSPTYPSQEREPSASDDRVHPDFTNSLTEMDANPSTKEQHTERAGPSTPAEDANNHSFGGPSKAHSTRVSHVTHPDLNPVGNTEGDRGHPEIPVPMRFGCPVKTCHQTFIWAELIERHILTFHGREGKASVFISIPRCQSCVFVFQRACAIAGTHSTDMVICSNTWKLMDVRGGTSMENRSAW